MQYLFLLNRDGRTQEMKVLTDYTTTWLLPLLSLKLLIFSLSHRLPAADRWFRHLLCVIRSLSLAPATFDIHLGQHDLRMKIKNTKSKIKSYLYILHARLIITLRIVVESLLLIYLEKKRKKNCEYGQKCMTSNRNYMVMAFANKTNFLCVFFFFLFKRRRGKKNPQRRNEWMTIRPSVRSARQSTGYSVLFIV